MGRRSILLAIGAVATTLPMAGCQPAPGPPGSSTLSPSYPSTPPVSPPAGTFTPFPSVTPPIRIAGIQQTNQGPYSASDFLVDTFWEAPIAQTWYLVYAGGVPLDPASPNTGVHGAVNLFTQGQAPNVTPTFKGFHRETSATGMLTVTSVSADIVALRDATGHMFSFNVVTHAYEAGRG